MSRMCLLGTFFFGGGVHPVGYWFLYHRGLDYCDKLLILSQQGFDNQVSEKKYGSPKSMYPLDILLGFSSSV